MKYKWNKIIKSFFSSFFFFSSYGQNDHKSKGLWEIHYLITRCFFSSKLFQLQIYIFFSFYVILAVRRMAWKITTGFLVFLLSLAFVSSKTEYQKAKLHGRKGLIELFHWISSKSYFLVRWKFVRIALGVRVIYLVFGFVFSNTSTMSGMINRPTTKLPGCMAFLKVFV